MSDSLWPHGLQQAKLPCPSLSPWICSNSCPLSQWCHPVISSSVTPFSSCLQLFPASGSCSMNWLFTSGGQSIKASVSVLPINIQSWFPLELTDFIPCSPRDSQESSPASHFKSINSSVLSLRYGPSLYTATGKTIALTIRIFVGKVMSLLFNMLSRFVIAFLPRSKHLLISLLQSPSTWILEPKKIKSAICFHFFPQLFATKWWDQMPWSSFFQCCFFKLAFSLFSFTLTKRLFSSLPLYAVRVVKVKVTQSYPTLCDQMDCIVHGILPEYWSG